MTVTYCTADQVISRLGFINQSDGTRFTDSSSTLPSTAELEEFINDAEDEIDRITNHAFRVITVTDEPHDFHHSYAVSHWRRSAIARLHHRNITTLASGSGDKLEIFDGSTFIDLLATGTEGTGFGENDFWVDKENGTIYIFSQFPIRGPGTIRVTYRYGDSSVPKDIRKACTLLAAIPVLQNDLYVRVFPANTDRFSLQSRAESYQKQVEKILARHIEWISL